MRTKGRTFYFRWFYERTKKTLTNDEQIDKLETDHCQVIEDRNQAIGKKYWKQSKEVN